MLSIRSYHRGELHGESQWFNSQGRVIKISQFHHGQLEGETLEFFPSGALRGRLPYHANELEGEVQRFYEHGIIEERRHFLKGQPFGVPLQYDRYGNPPQDISYPESEEMFFSMKKVWQTILPV